MMTESGLVMQMEAGPARGRLPTRWRLGLVLTFAMAVGNLLQFMLGALGPILTEDLALSRAQLGLLSSVYFGVGVGVSTRAGGLVDSLGGRTMLKALFVVSSLSLVAIATAPTFVFLVPAVAVAGVALATSNPVTNQLVAVNVPTGSQGVLLGLKQSGVQVSALLVGLLVPSLALAGGWRPVVAASALLGVTGVALTSLWIPAPVRRAPSRHRRSASVARLPLDVRWLGGYAFLMGAGLAAMIAYLPLYGTEEVGLSIPTAGMAAGAMGGVGVPARILWARAAERAWSPRPALLAIALLSATSTGLLILAAKVTWLIWPTAVALGATSGAWLAVAVVATVRAVDATRSGQASGVVLAGFYLGMLSCPPAFGWSVDRTGSWFLGWVGVTSMFLLSALLVGAWMRGARVREVGA